MTARSEPSEDHCSCCPNGFHIHVDFVTFAEEQLSLKKCTISRNNFEKIQDTLECSTRKASLISPVNSENSTDITEEAFEGHVKGTGSSTIKPVKRESALIQQKILDLQTCSHKTSEEIYGTGLLDAINEFETFVARTWGSIRPKEIATFDLETTDHHRKSLSPDSDPDKGAPSTDVTDRQTVVNLMGFQCKASDDICTFCHRKCPCKPGLIPSAENSKAPVTVGFECSTKGVNTESITHLNIATNTADELIGEAVTGRSEQLSKLTIRTMNPTTQQPDCGGEGNASSPLNLKQVETKSVELIKPSTPTTEEVECDNTEIIQTPKYPSDDMKAALTYVNEALLRGRTGRNVTASVSVILNEWFQTVGTKSARASDIVNYLNAFENYSPQLLRYMVNIPDLSGITALHYAVSYGNYPVVSKLLETNVTDPNKANKAGYTSIMLASLAEILTGEEEQTIRKLVSLGDVNIKAAQHGQTALMLAASHGRFQMVKLLLEAGAEVNAQDEDGSTALMCAVEHGHADVVQCLLAQAVCNPNLTDNDGLTALNVAMEAGHKDVAVLLYAHMHFVQTSRAAGSENISLVAKRSKSTTNAYPSYKVDNGETKDDLCCVARKQRSSIN